MKTTTYMVLARDSAGAWTELGESEGVNDKAAITRRVRGSDEIGDAFVAVPMRSWRPRTRKVEQVTRESWS